jgi:hypothetical protein
VGAFTVAVILAGAEDGTCVIYMKEAAPESANSSRFGEMYWNTCL